MRTIKLIFLAQFLHFVLQFHEQLLLCHEVENEQSNFWDGIGNDSISTFEAMQNVISCININYHACVNFS